MAKRIITEVDSSLSLSTADLMAALLMIFILLLVSTILRIEDEAAVREEIAEDYRSLKVDLYNDLRNEFSNDLDNWGAKIDSNLAIRFDSPRVMFAAGSDNLQPRFREILTDFFPRYLAIMQRNKYVDHIDEVRIEGHTTSSGAYRNQDPEAAYFYNMKLSQDRTRSVLEYVLRTISEAERKWSKRRITANGMSFSRPLDEADVNALADENRRVEFRIVTDAEAQIDKLLRLSNGQ